MRKILWLTSWYPNKMNPFSGDFIKRQAEAVSKYQPVDVLYVGKYFSESALDKTKFSGIENKSENLKESILYYPSSETGDHIISKFKSLYTYFDNHIKFIKKLHARNDLPDLVHVQVAMKAGLVALYLKWRYNIPYVVTEHWTGYYRQAKDSLFKKSFIFRFLTRLILKNASAFLPVSEALGNQITQYWIQIPFLKIPNVVNTRFFYPPTMEPANRFRFIHISSLIDQKNPEGIIRSFIELINLGHPAELVLVGPLRPRLNKIISICGLPPDKIYCTGEIPYDQVGIELRKSNAMVMFSNYENMPCVLLEALCSGIPVIATNVGGIPEVIQEDNGILISAGDENELLEAMKEMIRNHNKYDKTKISQKASAQFSFETVGKKITGVYDSVLKKYS
jgi:glycosyltransferase involved in cell wall biosynthesis